MKRFLWAVLTLSGLCLLYGCGGGSSAPPPPTGDFSIAASPASVFGRLFFCITRKVGAR